MMAKNDKRVMSRRPDGRNPVDSVLRDLNLHLQGYLAALKSTAPQPSAARQQLR